MRLPEPFRQLPEPFTACEKLRQSSEKPVPPHESLWQPCETRVPASLRRGRFSEKRVQRRESCVTLSEKRIASMLAESDTLTFKAASVRIGDPNWLKGELQVRRVVKEPRNLILYQFAV